MTGLDLRRAGAEAHARLLELNRLMERETSPLDAPRLAAMLDQAFLARALPGPEVSAFLIAFAPGAAYHSPNFRWFEARMSGFAYIDRVVTAPEARGRGLARRLYDALATEARDAGFTSLACEVNLAPPNPGSDAFHAALGFAEAGQGEANGKIVRYLTRPL